MNQSAYVDYSAMSQPFRNEANVVQGTTHSVTIGYGFWFFGGVFGMHRFYYGHPISGLIYALTGGLFLIGWIIDLFFIASMNQRANQEYVCGKCDYSIAWLLFTFLWPLGIHRFYQEKYITGILYLFTGGLLGLGFLFDLFTLNEQINVVNLQQMQAETPNHRRT